ncbi:uncharacterized protein LOC132938620 [Metopolophium dirhodum]|uniref:uncharacterized protein LOC132938620 n=1 Tax=Metopolophium dirhodum TaxID=44670 RepID=UPI00298FCA05|nr:uncharacterized protein LOC132938620 [Metopolophium dirhodum]
MEHSNDVQSEEKTAPIVVCTSQRDVSLDINKYSSLTKLLHVVSYLLRYKNNALSKRNNTSRIIGPLNVNEVASATKTVMKITQQAHFSREIEELKNNRNVSVKTRPKNVSPVMGNLPTFRVNRPSKCFENCGVDYAGPFMLKCSNRRNAATQKAYICVFVCFATKAVYLELVCELSTDAFLAALTRFISRRGLCKNIYSDNATCFVGANNKLSDLKQLMSSESHKDRNRQVMTSHEMTWHFIPSRAPHFGGLW